VRQEDDRGWLDDEEFAKLCGLGGLQGVVG